MSPDLETLRAPADSELAPAQRAGVDAGTAADPELATLSAALFAARLPYRSAFELGAPLPVPAALQARVAELASVARAANWRPCPKPARRWPGRLHRAPANVTLRRCPPALARQGRGRCSCCCAAWCWAACWRRRRRLQACNSRRAEPWLRSVISHHTMYSRQTVTDGGPASGLAQAAALRKALHDQQGLDLTEPDLRAQGPQFARAQRLQFDGRSVLQLVYLPGRGAPVAPCLMPAASQPERSLTLDVQQALA